MDYEYDVFVSYARVDNVPVHPAELGWVDSFIDILGIDLGMKLGRREAFRIWYDEQHLRGNHEVDGHIPEQVKKSRLFLAILSPGYASSEFCQRELQTFVDSLGGRGAERLFVVYKYPIDENLHKLPEPLRKPRKYQFWKPDQSKKPRTLGFPEPQLEERAYFQKIDDLAADIVGKLVELKMPPDLYEAEGATATVADASPAVLLADVTDDLETRREEVRRYLQQDGIKVYPQGSYRLVRDEFEQALATDLRKCAAFVQLLGPIAGKRPPDVPEGFGRLQYDLARRALAARPEFQILQWRNPSIVLADVESPQQRQLLTLDSVRAMPFEDFKQSIVRLVRPPARKPPARPDSSFVFINAAPADMAMARAIGERLGEFEWALPLHDPDAKAEAVTEHLETSVKECDCLVILYGNTRSEWVTSQLRHYRKLARMRDKELRLFAVAQAPPEPKPPLPMGLPGLKTARIDEIVDIIKSAIAP
jgi:TIR domain-containing protein